MCACAVCALYNCSKLLPALLTESDSKIMLQGLTPARHCHCRETSNSKTAGLCNTPSAFAKRGNGSVHMTPRWDQSLCSARPGSHWARSIYACGWRAAMRRQFAPGFGDGAKWSCSRHTQMEHCHCKCFGAANVPMKDGSLNFVASNHGHVESQPIHRLEKEKQSRVVCL